MMSQYFLNNDFEASTAQFSTFWAWIILIYAALNNATVPAINLRVGFNKYLKISWRFINQGLLLTPFTLYEYRQKKWVGIITWKNMVEHGKCLVDAALYESIALIVVLTICEFTFITHVIILSSLENFYFSIFRVIYNEETHFLERGGQVLVVFGILLMFVDIYSYSP